MYIYGVRSVGRFKILKISYMRQGTFLPDFIYFSQKIHCYQINTLNFIKIAPTLADICGMKSARSSKIVILYNIMYIGAKGNNFRFNPFLT